MRRVCFFFHLLLVAFAHHLCGFHTLLLLHRSRRALSLALVVSEKENIFSLILISHCRSPYTARVERSGGVWERYEIIDENIVDDVKSYPDERRRAWAYQQAGTHWLRQDIFLHFVFHFCHHQQLLSVALCCIVCRPFFMSHSALYSRDGKPLNYCQSRRNNSKKKGDEISTRMMKNSLFWVGREREIAKMFRHFSGLLEHFNNSWGVFNFFLHFRLFLPTT